MTAIYLRWISLYYICDGFVVRGRIMSEIEFELESFYLLPGRSRKFYWLPCGGIRTAAPYESLCWADPLRFPGKRRETKTVSCYKLDSMNR